MTALAVRRETQAVLRWVRPPQQERTRAALTRVLDAAETLLADKGFDDMSIAEVAKRAGTSVGGFYRRFPDKDRLLHAVHERFCDDARATADEALDPATWAGAPLAVVIAQVTAFLVQIYRDREGLMRALLLRGVTDAVVRQRTETVFEYIAERMRILLRERRDEISHPDPDTAAGFGLQVVLGTLEQVVHLQPSTTMPALRDDRLTEELTRVFTAYLGARAA